MSAVRIAVLGGTGFVGSAVARALRSLDVEFARVAAPRLTTTARNVPGLRDELAKMRTTVEHVALSLEGFDVVVNAAGIARATDLAGDSMYGANALLPGVVSAAMAANKAAGPSTRFVHVSSTAVQGRRPMLTEDMTFKPFSPYSHAKALGEVMCGVDSPAVRFRPTSVHGPGRKVTKTLARLLSSPLASVAGSGDYPTPQVHVDNVGHAVAMVAISETPPPEVVLQPSEHFTGAELVRVLGEREPRHVPSRLAHAVIAATMTGGHLAPPLMGVGRRLEILWCGQDQSSSWLESAGWTPVAGRDEWKALRCG